VSSIALATEERSRGEGGFPSSNENFHPVFQICYNTVMTTAEKNKKLGNLVEQKILEFLGDPDAGLELKKSFVTELRKRTAKKQKLISHAQVLRKYGLR